MPVKVVPHTPERAQKTWATAYKNWAKREPVPPQSMDKISVGLVTGKIKGPQKKPPIPQGQRKQLGGPIYNDPAKPLQGGAGMMKYRGGGPLPYTQRWASARAKGG